MSRPFTLLNPNRENPSVILWCDQPMEIAEDERNETSKVLKRLPMHVLYANKWQELHWPENNYFSDAYDEAELASVLEGTRNALASVLVCSPGGLAQVLEIQRKTLAMARRVFGWSTQSIVQKEAGSAAARLAISPERLWAPDDANVWFHIGFTKYGTDDYAGVSDVYLDLERLKTLAHDKKAFEHSGVEKEFTTILERPTVSSDDIINIAGKRLRSATVIRQKVTQRHIAAAIEELLLTDPPTEIGNRLAAFRDANP